MVVEERGLKDTKVATLARAGGGPHFLVEEGEGGGLEEERPAVGGVKLGRERRIVCAWCWCVIVGWGVCAWLCLLPRT